MSTKSILALLVATATLILGTQAAAQTSSGGWEFTIAPYLVAAGMSGTITAKGHEADVDVPFDTILANLKMGAMLHFQMANQHWVLASDIMYVDLEGSKDTASGTVTATMRETLFEVTGGYRVSPAVTMLAGARWVDLGVGLALAGPDLEREAKADKSWVDPLVGVHVITPISERWWLALHGDVGGFGVGSELTWQAYANIGFRASDLVSVIVGFRALDIDYKEGSGDDLFRCHVLTAGPQIAVAFRF
jgi:hypothetical protein